MEALKEKKGEGKIVEKMTWLYSENKLFFTISSQTIIILTIFRIQICNYRTPSILPTLNSIVSFIVTCP